MSKSRPQPWITARKEQPANGQSIDKSVPGPKPVSGLRWASVARWLHLYLSVVSFVLVLFFAVTGLTLNHADWFGDASRTNEYTGQLNPVWIKGTDTTTINKLAIVKYLRSAHQIRGAVSEVRLDEREASFSFRGPGYSADALVKRPDGTYRLTETKMGLVAVMNDLHKGRDTGRGWSWVIDVAAVFMTFVSVTGLLLLLFLKKRRVSGFWWLLAGGIASILAYLLIL